MISTAPNGREKSATKRTKPVKTLRNEWKTSKLDVFHECLEDRLEIIYSNVLASYCLNSILINLEPPKSSHETVFDRITIIMVDVGLVQRNYWYGIFRI